MRADKAMMVGVGLLGAFAVYKMVTGKKVEETPQPNAPLVPGLPSTPDRDNGTGLIMLGDPLHLQQGDYYRARLLLIGRTAFPFTNNADEQVLGTALAAMGFADIRVFMSIKELPSDWPASTTTGDLTGARWFQGMWKGPSMTLPRPLTIQAIWKTPRPANAVAVSGHGHMTG